MTPDVRYPLGRFKPTASPESADRRAWIGAIEALPGQMRAVVSGLDDTQLDTPYREGGWTVRQVVHHVPDSHMNAYVRMCLALTETEPKVRAYEEAAWANLTFARLGPIDVSLDLLASLHGRWLGVLRGMSEADFARRLIHPEKGLMTLDEVTELYAWHGRHHVGHVTSLREREGW